MGNALAQTDVPERPIFADDARDPFTPPLDAMIPEEGAAPDAVTLDQRVCDYDVRPESIQLLGLVTGTANPSVMFLVPGSNTAEFAHIGERMGADCELQISDIRDGSVVLENAEGATVELTLHPQG